MDTQEKHASKTLAEFSDLISKDRALKRLIKTAYYEAELEMGVNPKRLEQAHTGNLSENDFDYIKSVSLLVEKRLQDYQWIATTLENIENEDAQSVNPVFGIKFNDELFKGGREILQNYFRSKN